MIQKAREVLTLALLAVLVAVGLGAALLEMQISSAVKHVDDGIAQETRRLDGVLADGDATVASAGKSADELYKVVHASRLTVDNVNKAAIDERFYFEHQLPGLMDHASTILGNVETATADADPLLRSATARVDGLAPVESGAADLLAGANGLVADERIPEAIGNLDAATAQLAVASRESAETMGSVKAMAADGQAEVHSLTHPRPLVSIANWTLKVVHAIGGWF